MPITKAKNGGYRFGSKGKVYASRREALTSPEAQKAYADKIAAQTKQ